MDDITLLVKSGKAKPRRRYSLYRWIHEKIDKLLPGETLTIENLESVRQASSIINSCVYQFGWKLEMHLDKNGREDGTDSPIIHINWRSDE